MARKKELHQKRMGEYNTLIETAKYDAFGVKKGEYQTEEEMFK